MFTFSKPMPDNWRNVMRIKGQLSCKSWIGINGRCAWTFELSAQISIQNTPLIVLLFMWLLYDKHWYSLFVRSMVPVATTCASWVGSPRWSKKVGWGRCGEGMESTLSKSPLNLPSSSWPMSRYYMQCNTYSCIILLNLGEVWTAIPFIITPSKFCMWWPSLCSNGVCLISSPHFSFNGHWCRSSVWLAVIRRHLASWSVL